MKAQSDPRVLRGWHPAEQSLQRSRVIIGVNKGMGFDTAQLASKDVSVIFAARDEKKGLEAASKLHQMGFPDVVFHQLDVLDPANRLDILVNNAGASELMVDEDGLRALNKDPADLVINKLERKRNR